MILERITLGTTPSAEECTQVGDPHYTKLAQAECRAYANQLRRVLQKFLDGKTLPETEFKLVVKGHPHDFGTYYEVDCRYNEDNALAVKAAMYLESHVPDHWDAEAVRELDATALGLRMTWSNCSNSKRIWCTSWVWQRSVFVTLS
jgi:hypothetical protein